MLTGLLEKPKELTGILFPPAARVTEGDHYTAEADAVRMICITSSETVSAQTGAIVDEGLSFNGSQVVRTAYCPTQDTLLEVEFRLSALTSTTQFVLGSRSASVTLGDSMALGCSTSVTYPMFGASRSSIAQTVSEDEVHTVRLGAQGYWLDGVRLKTFETMHFTGAHPLFIGCLNQNGSPDRRGMVGEIYEVRAYEGETLVHRWISSRLADGSAVGLLDVVTRDWQPQTAINS